MHFLLTVVSSIWNPPFATGADLKGCACVCVSVFVCVLRYTLSLTVYCVSLHLDLPFAIVADLYVCV